MDLDKELLTDHFLSIKSDVLYSAEDRWRYMLPLVWPITKFKADLLLRTYIIRRENNLIILMIGAAGLSDKFHCHTKTLSTSFCKLAHGHARRRCFRSSIDPVLETRLQSKILPLSSTAIMRWLRACHGSYFLFLSITFKVKNIISQKANWMTWGLRHDLYYPAPHAVLRR